MPQTMQNDTISYTVFILPLNNIYFSPQSGNHLENGVYHLEVSLFNILLLIHKFIHTEILPDTITRYPYLQSYNNFFHLNLNLLLI